MSTEKQRRYLKDIVTNATKIASYIEGMNQAGFEGDEKTIDAVERCLQRISEVAARLKDQAGEWLPAHDWPAIRSLGNRLRHEYDGSRSM